MVVYHTAASDRGAVRVSVQGVGDQPAYLTYAGPNPLGAHQVFGFRSPKRNLVVNYSAYGGNAQGSATSVSCRSGSPGDEHCFTLDHAPVNTDVRIHAQAWQHDGAYADETYYTVQTVPDPPS